MLNKNVRKRTLAFILALSVIGSIPFSLDAAPAPPPPPPVNDSAADNSSTGVSVNGQEIAEGADIVWFNQIWQFSVNPLKKEILLTNIPRDYYVKLHSFNEYDKLTHAGIYGIDESISTIEDLLDTKINYYVKVNFTSLIDIVDALDGIVVNSNYSFTTVDGYSFKKGTNYLDGKEALSFARERKAFKEGDRIRGENQQLILTSIINKSTSTKIITNYTEILKAVKGKFITNIKDEEITKLIKMQFRDGQAWNIKSISVNGVDSYDYVYSYKKNKLYVMRPIQETVDNAIGKIKDVMK